MFSTAISTVVRGQTLEPLTSRCCPGRVTNSHRSSLGPLMEIPRSMPYARCRRFPYRPPLPRLFDTGLPHGHPITRTAIDRSGGLSRGYHAVRGCQHSPLVRSANLHFRIDWGTLRCRAESRQTREPPMATVSPISSSHSRSSTRAVLPPRNTSRPDVQYCTARCQSFDPTRWGRVWACAAISNWDRIVI